MNIVTNPVDWERLCELYSAPLEQPGYEYSMADILDGLKVMRRARSIFDQDKKHFGDEVITIQAHEFFDLAMDLVERLETGRMLSSPEFYGRLKPTPIGPRQTLRLLNELRRREEKYVKRWQREHGDYGRGTEFSYIRHLEPHSPSEWLHGLNAYYTLSRICGMIDKRREGI